MRLAKYLATAGIASRRRAEIIISSGRVTVNGLVIHQPQHPVREDDIVTVDGNKVTGCEKKRYLVLHKPSGYVTTSHDTHNRPTVIDLINDIDARVYPVGRLDYDTSGALLVTNDGELAHRLTHPRYRVEKVYHALVEGIVSRTNVNKMSAGLMIERRITAPAEVTVLKRWRDKNMTMLQIVLTEGRKRQVKKMCAALGHPVIELHRESFAGITPDGLTPGKYRFLSAREVEGLYRLVGLAQ